MTHILVRRQRQDSRPRVTRDNALDGFYASGARHGQIHDDDVRLGLGIECNGLFAAVGLGHYQQVFSGLQQQTKSHAHDRVVIHQHDGRARHGCISNGSRATTSVPVPGREIICRLPPEATARSRMPRTP